MRCESSWMQLDLGNGKCHIRLEFLSPALNSMQKHSESCCGLSSALILQFCLIYTRKIAFWVFKHYLYRKLCSLAVGWTCTCADMVNSQSHKWRTINLVKFKWKMLTTCSYQNKELSFIASLKFALKNYLNFILICETMTRNDFKLPKAYARKKFTYYWNSLKRFSMRIFQLISKFKYSLPTTSTSRVMTTLLACSNVKTSICISVLYERNSPSMWDVRETWNQVEFDSEQATRQFQ